MPTITQLLTDLLNMLESAVQPRGPLFPGLAITPSITARAATVLARANADKAAPGRITSLRTTYETAFGFGKPLREGAPDKPIWEPWEGMTQADFEATLAVAKAVGVRPEHVLALWIQEGKHINDGTLHGSTTSFGPEKFSATVDMAQLRSWLRTLILWNAFGSDRFGSVTFNGRDNVPHGADHDHNARFLAGLRALRIANVPGTDEFTDADALRYFSSTQGALRDVVMTTPAGVAITATLPAGEFVTCSVRLRQTSLASWLYLQTALFTEFRKRMEDLFIAEYGPPMDLSTTPWVTYIGWNGKMDEQYLDKFSKRPLGETPEERIAQLFDIPPSSPLSAEELAKYFGAGIARAPLASAVQYKYLVEAVAPWFAVSP